MKTNKSSEDCAAHNAQHKLEIEHGVVDSWEPSDAYLAQEKKDAERITEQALVLTMLKNLIRKAVGSSNFANDLAKLDEEMAKWKPGFNSECITIGKVNLRIEKYTSWTPGSWHSNGSYYRMALSGISKWEQNLRRSRTIYKDVACKLNGNTTVEKVTTWLNEKVGERIRYNTQQAQSEQGRLIAVQLKTNAFEDNRESFTALGIENAEKLVFGHADQDGKIGCAVNFMLTSEQWKQLAEWKKNLATV